MQKEKKEKKKKGDTQKSDKSKSKSKDKDKDKQKSKSKSKDSNSVKKKSKQPKEKSKKSADLKQSQVSSITPPPTITCIHHKAPFIYFCQTCEQLVCNQCIVFGPHNNHLHRILKITDAYRSRVYYLSEAIRSNLVEKRDKIIAQLHRIQYRVEQIRFIKNIIERDIRSQYGGYLQRLKSSEGTKLALISHQISLIQRDVDSINQLGNKFFELTNIEGENAQKLICKFLSKSKQMYEAIQYFLNKPEREKVNIDLNDFPREVQKNRIELKKALSAKEISQFKNEIIWQLVQESRVHAEQVKKQLQQKADLMIRKLSDQAQRLNLKLSEYQIICAFCGASLGKQTVNEKCTKNGTDMNRNLFQKFTQICPNQNQMGTNRHFFSKPSKQYQQLVKNQ